MKLSLSVKLRGWRRGRFLQRLRAAGARFGRKCGPVHQAAAARPGSKIRLEEQTGIRRRSVYPAPASDATDGAVFWVRRSLASPMADCDVPVVGFPRFHQPRRLFTDCPGRPEATSPARVSHSASRLLRRSTTSGSDVNDYKSAARSWRNEQSCPRTSSRRSSCH